MHLSASLLSINNCPMKNFILKNTCAWRWWKIKRLAREIPHLRVHYQQSFIFLAQETIHAPKFAFCPDSLFSHLSLSLSPTCSCFPFLSPHRFTYLVNIAQVTRRNNALSAWRVWVTRERVELWTKLFERWIYMRRHSGRHRWRPNPGAFSRRS